MEYRQHLTEQEKNYDKLCGITLTNIFTLTKNCDTIPFRSIDIKNKEHLYALCVGFSLAGVVGKKVSVSAKRRTIRKLNRLLGIKDKDCRIISMPVRDTMYSIDPQMLVDDLRDEGKKLCGEDFTFADIYNEFYERKKK